MYLRRVLLFSCVPLGPHKPIWPATSRRQVFLGTLPPARMKMINTWTLGPLALCAHLVVRSEGFATPSFR